MKRKKPTPKKKMAAKKKPITKKPAAKKRTAKSAKPAKSVATKFSPPEELARAFTPFWRADGSRTRRTGGVGLGLALARRIARTHGGDVVLRSAPQMGTTALLEVPLAS